MKIGIDLTPALKDKAGIGYVAFSMIEALSKIDTNNQYELLTNIYPSDLNLNLASNFKITVIDSTKADTFWMLKGSKYLKENKFDAFISTSNFLWSIIYPNTIQMVHDIAPIRYPQFFSKKGSLFYNIQLRLALKKARFVVTISKTVLGELLQMDSKPNKDFILLGLHDWALSTKNEAKNKEVFTKYNLPPNYLIMVGTLEPRKNHVTAIKAFSLFIKDYPLYKLVIVGKKGWFYNEIFKTVSDLKLENSVIFTGYVPEADLASLIDLSIGGIQLSIYEGFGLPIIEFTARGKPVLASNIAVFKEVATDINSVIFVNPSKPEDIKMGMVNLMNNIQVTDQSVIKKYSWESFAEKLLSIIQNL